MCCFGIEAKDTTEWRYLRSDQPQAGFATLLPRKKDHRYYVDHRDGVFYIRTNRDGVNFSVVTAPASDPVQKNWKVWLPHRKDTLLQDMDLFKDFAVSVEKSEAVNHLRIYSFSKKSWTEIPFSEKVYSASPGGTVEYGSPTYRYNYQSFVTPSSVYDYDVAGGKSTLLKRHEVLGGYDPTQYVSERLWATARDGTKVPVSIVYKKGVARDGKAPLFLYAYGSVRVRNAGDVLHPATEPAGSWDGVRDRAHTRRRRDGLAVAAGRDADEKEEYVLRLRGQRGVSHQGEVDVEGPAGDRRAGARAGCSWAPW